MITAIRLQNLRSIVDSNWIGMAPITIVVGKNSAGKSSFLRTFPLLKQSLEADTQEPLLWFGRFVDFGSFNDVISRHAEEKELTLSFKVNNAPKVDTGVALTEGGETIFYYVDERRSEIFLQRNVEMVASLTLKKRDRADGTYVSRIAFTAMQDTIEIYGNEDDEVVGIKMGDGDIVNVGRIKIRPLRNGFFPGLISIDAEGTKLEMVTARRDGPFFSYALAQLDWLFHGNTKAQKRRQTLRQMKWGASRDFYEHLKALIPGLDSRLFWSESNKSVPPGVARVRRLILLQLIPRILAHFNSQLSELAGSVRYLAPVRATAARYYRFQELSVDQIDPQGDNVPMFLNSLNESERSELESWMQNALGFSVKSIRSGGHAVLVVTEGEGAEPLNLTDTGFGYSQVLPVVLQIWKSLRDNASVKKARDRPPFQIVIEQPELHLHPQFQAALADVLASATSSEGGEKGRVSFLIETHSEHIVNRLGELIERGVLRPSDVQLVLFDKKSSSMPTEVRSASFDERGVMQGDWPFGFFVPQL